MTFESNIETGVNPAINRPEVLAAEQSARATQRLSVLGEMTRGIAHDFRNILAVIDSGLRPAERNASDRDMVRSFVAGAREGVDRGLRLTSQLLTFARQGKLPTSAADVNALLANLEQFLKYGAGSLVRIVFQFSPNLPQCFVDQPQFAAAILSLVINGGGIIEITTTRRDLEADTREGGVAGAYVRLRVRDNGLGMTEDVMKKIFESFFTTKGENGTGLGLPQVCAFMHSIGGRLNVDSEVGWRTTFDLFLPAVKGDKTAAPADAA